MNLYKNLLFLHGYLLPLDEARRAVRPAAAPASPAPDREASSLSGSCRYIALQAGSSRPVICDS